MSKSADAFRTISEVADWLGVQTHVLRFWESKFSQIKPVKRAGGRRYYRPADMLLLGGIRKLLHEDGLTIKGVQKLLREEGMAHVCDMSGPLDDETAAQMDADIAPEADFVEAELAPLSSDDTVTPFVPMAKPAPEPPQDPIEAQADPEPEPAPISAPIQTPDPTSAPVDDTPPASEPEPAAAAAPPEPEPGPVPQDPDVATPVPAESLGTPQKPAAEPVQAATPPPDATDGVGTPEPSFAHARDRAPVAPHAVEDDTAPVGLPSFLTARTQEPPPDPATDTQAVAPEHVTPRPRIVDVPDEDAPESVVVAPSALGLVGRIKHLTPAQRSAVRPLLAQLTALRDQMAGAHRDPR